MKISAALGKQAQHGINITEGSFGLLYLLWCPDETRFENQSVRLLNMRISFFFFLIKSIQCELKHAF